MQLIWLPDWQEEGQYPDPSKTSPVQWAWEFLRRNCEYQELWFETVGTEIDISEPGPIWSQRQEPTSPGKRTRPRINSVFREKFHVATNPPPPPWEREAKLVFEPEFIQYDAADSETERGVLGSLKRGKIAVWFDLGWPVDRQLDNARKVFEAEVVRQKIENEKRRSRFGKYRNYLRVLDATVDGASRDEIAAALYRNLDNKYPDYSGRHAVRDALKAASRLRDYEFWQIALFKQD